MTTATLQHLNTPTLLISVVLFVFLIWLETRRKGRSYFRKGMRYFCNILLIASLLLLILQPVYLQSYKPFSAILLTNGFNVADLDSLQATGTNRQIFSNLEGLKLKNHQAQYIPDFFYLNRKFPLLDSLIILGNGVPESSLSAVKQDYVHFIGSEPPEGIVDLRYNTEIALTDTLQISMTYNKPVEGKHLLKLGSDEGIAFDSIIVEGMGEQMVKLKTLPRVPGRLTYRLTVENETGDLLTSEIFPVVVNDIQQMQILIVNSFPTFELKHLKNWLERKGNGLAMRHQISKDKYRYEFINRQKASLSLLDKELLRQFDVLMIDAGSLSSLSKRERNNIRNTISDTGLGLLILGDGQLENQVTVRRVREFYSGLQLKSVGHDQITSNEFGTETPMILYNWPFEIVGSWNADVLINANGNYVAKQHLGLGMVGINLISKSYHLLLEGKTREYSLLWSKILNEVSRREQKQNYWNEASVLAFVNEPLELQLTSNESRPIGIAENSAGLDYKFYLQEDVHIPQLFHGKIWPDSTGWLRINTEKDSMDHKWVFIQSDTAWLDLRLARQLYHNRLLGNRAQQSLVRQEVPNDKMKKVPISNWWFFIVFVMAAGTLWLEPKL
ncbi:hypothetical protein QQ008_13150 [Fulvivirgaceae bacterium BMA10]|uniref:VWA domain-containing protein n=1 Tax=Splendidivirga corallicola TaxID=3051826 RepID=A0ABT8KNP2_9BACT|nr:hypothetical protein [Fulvivirgaceae bacterium BMA10]